MSIDNDDGVTLIGMHTLESLASDGLLPQLQALASRPRSQWTYWNVVTFPLNLTRAPGSALPVELGSDAANGANVIAFRHSLASPLERSRKA